jgi:glycosyltransferase involved in cell wall biosynthesis
LRAALEQLWSRTNAMAAVDVTVIVPTFRRAGQLVQAVRSALAQDGVGLEVSVLDDSPEGSAREPIESIRDPRVTYSKRAIPSLGRPALVRNEGWPQARGRYVHFLDDDDVVVPGAYRAHVEALDANARAAMSFGRIEPFGDDDAAIAREREFWARASRRAKRASRLGPLSHLAMVATILFDEPLFQNSACMVRKSTLEGTGGFDPLMPVQEDAELHVRGIRRYGCVFLDRTVIRYRVNTNSLMRSNDMQAKILESYRRMRQKYRDEHGAAELAAMKLFGRSGAILGRMIP